MTSQFSDLSPLLGKLDSRCSYDNELIYQHDPSVVCYLNGTTWACYDKTTWSTYLITGINLP